MFVSSLVSFSFDHETMAFRHAMIVLGQNAEQFLIMKRKENLFESPFPANDEWRLLLFC